MPGDPQLAPSELAVTAAVPRSLASGALQVGFAWLVLGPAGSLATSGVLLALVVRDGAHRASRVAAVAAAGLLAAAGLATVLEEAVTGTWNLTFATSRPVAASLGALAGVAAMGCITAGLGVERSRDDRRFRPSAPTAVAARVSLTGPMIVGLASAGAIGLRALEGPGGPERAVLQVRDNVELGIAYAQGLPDGTAVAPVVPTLLALGVGADLLAGLALVVCVGAVWVMARRRGVVHGAGACAVAALLPSLWSQPLPVLLAAAAVASGLAALTATASSREGQVMGLALLAVGAMADPSCLVLWPVLAAWSIAAPSGVRVTGSRVALAFAGTALLSLAVARATGATLEAWSRAGGSHGSLSGGWLVVDAIAGIALLAALRRYRWWMTALPLLALATTHLGRPGDALWGWAAGTVAVVASTLWAERAA
ncbi:MAG: hypothetical protein ACRDYW_09355 [Acidimicrobiales bacterium]